MNIRNQKGMAHVAMLLVVLIMAAIGGGGYYVYHKNHTKNAAPAKVATPATNTGNKNSTPKVADPYTGWKKATLKYEKLSFKYPSDWKVTVNSSPQNACITPGRDTAYLTAPDKATITMNTGLDCIGDLGGWIHKSTTIKTMGGEYYLDYMDTNTNVDAKDINPNSNAVCVDSKPNAAENGFPPSAKFISSKNIKEVGSDSKPLNYFCYFNGGTLADRVYKSEAKINSTASFKQAKLIFESLSY